MTDFHIFADEAGNFDFSRKGRASKYFIVCTVTMQSCDVAHDLLNLRRQLIWDKKPVGHYFHATEDKQEVRDAVFSVLNAHKFYVHAQIMEKSKAQPQLRTSDDRFYQHGWLYLLRFGTSKVIWPSAKLLITTATIGPKRIQQAFTRAVNDVANQTLKNATWTTCFCPAAVDPCLQVADYCTWAIQRKWEHGDARSHNLIKNRIFYEYDLFGPGKTHYY